MKISKLLLSLILLCFVAKANAQSWTEIHASNFTNSLYTITASGNYKLVDESNAITGYIIVNTGVEATLDLNGVTLSYGGAAKSIITNNGTLTIVDNATVKGAIDGGSTALAVNGRGIYNAIKAATLTIDGITIRNCNASTKNGGGIYNNLGTLNFKSGTITKCCAANHGGGIYNTGTVNFEGGMIHACYVSGANSGGGIYTTGTLNMSGDATIQYCKAQNGGGGVFVFTTGTFTMDDGTIKYCRAVNNVLTDTVNAYGTTGYNAGTTRNGGGVYVNNTTMNFNGGTISDCFAASTAGAVAVNDGSGKIYINSDNCLITRNVGYNCGGALLLSNGGKCYMKAGEISYNRCQCGNSTTDTGGGAVAMGYGTGGTFEMSGGKICHNSNECVSGLGGAIWMRANNGTAGTVKISGGEISENHAKYGGAIYSQGTNTFTGGHIKNNTADEDGGGIYNKGTLTLNGITLEGNTAQNGGGIYSASTLTLTSGVIRNCMAVKGGGGIYNASTFTLTSGVIRNCMAVKGGGIYAAYDFTMNGGTIEYCYAVKDGDISYHAEAIDYGTADYCGGGVYLDNKKMTFNGGTISNCYAAQGAGGIYAYYTSGNLEFNNGLITHNTAYNYGGGIYLSNGADCTMSNGVISYNKCLAGGPYAGGGGVGVGFSSTTTFTMNNGKIIYNRLEGSGVGGGVGMNSEDGKTSTGTVTINGGEISGNYSPSDGGGLYLINTATVTGTGNVKTIIRDNEAGRNGGGIFLSPNVALSLGTTAQPTYELHITDNRAGGNGGGIYVSKDNTCTATLYASSYWVCNNKGGLTDNDVYLPSGKYLLNNISTDNYLKLKSFGVYTEDIPESAPGVPIINNTRTNVLSTLYAGLPNGTYNVYDSRREYKVMYYSSGTSEQKKYLYLTTGAEPWSPLQQTVTTDDYVPNDINSVKRLTAFMWKVNGLEIFAGNGDATASGTITADIDMTGHYWVPIGLPSAPYTGTLEGNAHAISHISMATDSWTSSYNGANLYGLVGNVGRNGKVQNLLVNDFDANTGASAVAVGGVAAQLNGGDIINCYASSLLSANESNCKLGGLVGTANSGNIYNSFSYPKFAITNDAFTGGLVGNNNGTVANCYVREHEGNSCGSHFGWLAGQNAGTIDHCYAPNDNYISSNTGTLSNEGVYTPSKFFSMDIAHDNRVGNVQLEALLNRYVTNPSHASLGLVKWLRPTTTRVNAGLPVLKYNGTNAVASLYDGTLDYSFSLTDLISMLNDNAIGGIFLYENVDFGTNTVTQNTAIFAIHPSVSVLQANNSKNIKALVSIPMQYTSGTKYYHGISSPVASWPLGFAYGNTAQVAYNDNKNPCLAYMGIADGIFPQDVNLDAPTVTSSLPWDFYDFQESTSHWVNYRRNSLSHWDEQDHDTNLNYTNHTTMQAAKGYLAALALPSDFNNDSILLQHEGMLNYGSISVPVTNHAYAYHHGINMIGNPYESYLDFDVLASTNSALWTSGNQFYGAYDKDNGFVYYAPGASEDYPYTASRYIHKHQGFFVRLDNCAETGNSMQFTESMRTNDGTPHFRDWERNYPLVNLIVTDSEGATDVCVVEMNRPDEGGALKLVPMVMSNGVLYAHRNGNDYGIVFTDGQENVPLWFETNASENFMLTWNTRHGEFSYLHLIDNIAGADIDMLTSQQYIFAANTNDYKSRFKLVCQCTGVDENADTDTESAEAFAFVNDGQLIVNGDGLLQIFDLNGRILQQTILDGAMNTVSLPEMATGLYILKLNGKTQKIVME